jgi:antitoxin PrlF
MIQSRISSKAQTTIPRAVRAALGLREGDSVAYRIEGDRVVLTRAEPPDPFVGNFSTFTEWADEADSAYDVLGRR